MSYPELLTAEVLAFEALCDCLEAYINNATRGTVSSPEQWDEEYAEEAVVSALDRLICAGRSKRTKQQRERFRQLLARAEPFRQAAQ